MVMVAKATADVAVMVVIKTIVAFDVVCITSEVTGDFLDGSQHVEVALLLVRGSDIEVFMIATKTRKVTSKMVTITMTVATAYAKRLRECEWLAMESIGCFSGVVIGAAEEEDAAARQREWEEAADAVAYDSCTMPPPIVVVYGPGNSGKSAFSRLLLNTLLQRYDKVGYLDIDVGQPEFTPPGFVSLHVLEEQTKDFTILYLRNPKRCYFFGDVCAKRNTKLLLAFTFGLYEYFLKECYFCNYVDDPEKSVIPLVINTSGWVKGTELHVFLSGYTCFAECLLVKKEARTIRDLRLMAYFRQCLPRDFPIVHSDDIVQGLVLVQPFQLHLSKIQVSGTDLYHFLNGTIVGMATSVSPPLSTECSTPCCIGLGFVKAIDYSKDCIHLIAPVSDKIMEKVDIIFQSYIAVPSCLLQDLEPCRHFEWVDLYIRDRGLEVQVLLPIEPI
ncbi:hypothetical protein PR202_gb20322 [Eleusine coracana subsp. coracana]|uniref:Uncharacterized protein n=1 Tax=Eleusine coracana subsp. coracana TaxID=191504 RepID=A0AAV5F891_ELECO|nr:hypothetical protein PR202_gb20322 [Eleusine coracana subsp. coracana]